MKLQLHVGTEKTGSSYLQKLCGKNRQFLRSYGYWFPDAGRHEKRLQRGTISPGNAHELSSLIRDLEWRKVAYWLGDRVKEARKNECTCLLLSNEVLFVALSCAGAVDQFEKAAAKAGIEQIGCLLMIRDPVDQALSLYKHRAKSGAAGEIDEWLVRGYFVPKHLSEYLDQIDRSEIKLHLRKYSKKDAAIESVFFNDWLGIESPPVRIESLVNPSLSLSELAVIRHVAAARPRDLSAFYSNFFSVSLENKARDGDAESLATAKVECSLSRYNMIWEALDVRLAEDGGLRLPRVGNAPEFGAPQYVFSEAQLRAWTQAHEASVSFQYAVHDWITSSLRPRAGKLIRKFVPRFGKR